MNILIPYDYDVTEQVFQDLFMSGKSREDGLMEIPAASIQLVVSALEMLKWDCKAEDLVAFGKAIAVCQRLRDEQKMREWKRKREELN